MIKSRPLAQKTRGNLLMYMFTFYMFTLLQSLSVPELIIFTAGLALLALWLLAIYHCPKVR